MRKNSVGIGAIVRERWQIIVAAWALPALLAALETWTFWRMAGRSYPFWRAVLMEAPAWLVYAVLTPFIFLLSARLPLERPRFARNLTVHLVIALVAGVGYALAATAATKAFTPIPNPRPFGQMAFMWYLSALPLTTLAYFCILGVASAIAHFNEARQREVDAARLSAQLADARLAALRMQLHPHFLFNTLNAITVLARDREFEPVVRMLTLLSDLLRDVLRTDRGKDVSLATELAFSRRYLEIETVRFAERLRIREHVDDSIVDALVPAFILQPLLENALRHGIANSTEGGIVTVAAQGSNGQLELCVENTRSDDARNDAVAAHALETAQYGVGLSNTASRLETLFGENAALTVSVASDGPTRATIRIPLRRAP